MGDRANIVIASRAVKDSDTLKEVLDSGSVVLYGHWSGERMPFVAQEALSMKWRWTDGAYLARIVFDVLTSGQHDRETGFGISTNLCDNEHLVTVLDVMANRVIFFQEEDGQIHSWTFQEYVDASHDSIMAIYNPSEDDA